MATTADGQTEPAGHQDTVQEAAAGDYAAGWQPCVDESTGYTYYWNSQTNEVAWQPPDYSSLLQPPPPPPPPLPTGPDPQQLAKQGIQMITSYGGDSTDSESDDDQPVRSARPAPAATAARSTRMQSKQTSRTHSPSPVAEYGPSLPSPAAEYGPSLPSPAVEYGPSLPSPAVEYGPSLPSPAVEYGPSPPSPAAEYGPSPPSPVAAEYGPSLPAELRGGGGGAPSPQEDGSPPPPPLSMGPFGTTAAGFIGPLIPDAAAVSSPAEDTGEGMVDSEEEALLSELKARAAQLEQLGGELPSSVKATIEAESAVKETADGTPPPTNSRKRRRDKRAASAEGTEPSEDVPRRKKRSLEESAVTMSKTVSQPIKDDPMLNLISEIENEQPPDYPADEPTPTSSEQKKERTLHVSEWESSQEEKPSEKLLTKSQQLSSETVIASKATSNSSTLKSSRKTKPAEVAETKKSAPIPTLDIFSEIENEVPPDYEAVNVIPEPDADTKTVVMDTSEDGGDAELNTENMGDGGSENGESAENSVSTKEKISDSEMSDPFDVISAIESERPPDYDECSYPTSRNGSNSGESFSKNKRKAASNNSSTKEVHSRSRRHKGKVIRAEQNDSREREVCSPIKRRRSRHSVQGMGLIASYGSESGSDSDMDGSPEAPIKHGGETRRLRGDAVTPPLPSGSQSAAPVTRRQSRKTAARTETDAARSAAVPDRALSPEVQRAAAASYSTFSAGSYETPVLSVQDGTHVGLGFHGAADAASADRLAWESAAVTDRRGPRAAAAPSRHMKFVQFQKGTTLKPTTAGGDDSGPATQIPTVDGSDTPPSQQLSAPDAELRPSEDAASESEIRDLVAEMVDKLDFLGVASETASPLKVLAVQTQTLLDAWSAGALRAQYLLRWLAEEAAAFADRERQSAPPGWSMRWIRAEKCYIYTHEKSGRTSTVFPEDGAEPADTSPQRTAPLHPQEPPSAAARPVAAASSSSASHTRKRKLKKSAAAAAAVESGASERAAPTPPSESAESTERVSTVTVDERATAAEVPPPPPPPPPPTLRPSADPGRLPPPPPPPALSTYEPPPPGEEAAYEPPPHGEEAVWEAPPAAAQQLLSELDSFYSEVGLLDEMSAVTGSATVAAAGSATVAAASSATVAAVSQLTTPAETVEAAASDATAQPAAVKKKKKVKMSSGALIHKKKGVDQLVAKWKTVQKQLK